MIFGNNFLGKSNNIEIIRFCNKKGLSVIGGAKKIYSHFLTDNPTIKTVTSYCDISKGRGTLYEKLGMNLVKITEPNYIWYNFYTKEEKSRYQTQIKDENKIMREKNFVKIYDSGNYFYEYKRRKNE